jgi:hypothetical protein
MKPLAHPILTDQDELHAQLARGAVREATDALEDHAEGTADIYTPDADVVNEAIAAWVGIGLVPSSFSDFEKRQVAEAMIGATATVLVMVGWTPPDRLLEE